MLGVPVLTAEGLTLADPVPLLLRVPAWLGDCDGLRLAVPVGLGVRAPDPVPVPVREGEDEGDGVRAPDRVALPVPLCVGLGLQSSLAAVRRRPP